MNSASKIRRELLRKTLHIFGVSIYLTYLKFGVEGSFLYLLVCFSISLLFEITRLKAYRYFPFKFIIRKVVRDEERWKFGAHIYFFIGSILAFIISFFNENAIIGIMCMVFSDAAGAIVGVTVGKHRISRRGRKTVEGAVAGGAVAFLTVYIMMKNLVASIVLATVYIIVDSLNININDNLLLPVCFTLALNILVFLR
ncbi:MAG: hypothetical protein NDF53_02135 [archaeon GB-1867-097]|nr:hypothetical protein [Candidatus Culexmicrobium thermophilum]MCS7384514.1 hypothetical protein [Candidatus Culexmicrobium thermophilum]